MHCLTMVIGWNYEDIQSFLENACGQSIDYFEKITSKNCNGLVSKNKGKFVCKAKIKDVDWVETRKRSDIYMMMDYRMGIDKDDFRYKGSNCYEDEFWDFVMERIKNGEVVALFDVHI